MMMVSSLSALSSSASTSFSSTSNATTEIFGTTRSQCFEEKIPLTSKKEIERKLASILTQIQQNQVTRLDLRAATLGRFYEHANTLKGHEDAIYGLAALPKDQLASCAGNTIKIWDLASHSCISTLQGHADSVNALAILLNGQQLASGAYDHTIKLWDLASHSCLSTLQGHSNSIRAVAVLPNGLLVSSSNDTTIKLWDLASHSCLATLQGHTDHVNALAALPNGHLASGSCDATIKLWDLASGSCLSTLQGHTHPIYALTVLPNGLLASGAFDSTIKLWDLASHSCLFTLQETSPVCALTVLPNGLLASGAFDATIRLWDLTSHSCLSTLEGHTDYVYALAAFPNSLFASGSSDETIKLWEPRTLSAKQLLSILSALKKNISVTDLDLSNSSDIKDDIINPLINIFKKPGFFSFFSSKPNTTLKTIDLRSTGVSQKGVKKLERAIKYQRLSVEVLADCPLEWMMIYFLIIFCRANRNSPFADSGLELCKYGEIGPFLGIPSGCFARSRKNPSSNSKHVDPSPS